MKFVAKTLYGLEQVLSEELVSLGALDVQLLNRAVLFEGDKEMLYKVNYCSRTALSVLMPIAEFRIRSKEDLYEGAMRIKWEKYMDEKTSFSIVPVINSQYFDHSGFPGLILKDAIADFFRLRKGKRPDVNSDNPDILINLHISNSLVTISLDSTVVPLYKRGYRKEQSVAPLNEVLAAGMLLISGWNASSDLIDPMCGSGTIPIEAGLIACNIPPGKFRTFFGFMKWKDFDEDIFNEIKSKCDKNAHKPEIKISGSDISPRAVKQSEVNIESVGLTGYIKLKVSDFADLKSSTPGHIFLNPPYGIRIVPDELNNLYGMIGTTLKHGFPGSTAWLITPNLEALKHVGLKPESKNTLFNGSLKCVLAGYKMYPGSRKK